MALNKVMLIGNVGKDPEVRYLESGPQNPSGNAKVASFPLATSERFRDRNGEVRENTEWHNIVAWRNSADVVEKYVKKGTQLYIEGKLRTRSWVDQTGNKRYTTEVVADSLQLLGRRPDGSAEGDSKVDISSRGRPIPRLSRSISRALHPPRAHPRPWMPLRTISRSKSSYHEK